MDCSLPGSSVHGIFQAIVLEWIAISFSRLEVVDISPGNLDFPAGSDGKASVYNAGDRVRSLGQDDPLEKEMAIHSSTTAWKIPWTEEPVRLQFMGSQRVGHD